MTGIQCLAGHLQVRPGLRRPHSLASTRRALAGVLLTGQPTVTAPRLLGSLFTLCGHAHALCATLALAAAQGEEASASAAQRRALQRETARDHVLRIHLDWPIGLRTPGSPTADDASRLSLQTCPLRVATTPIQDNGDHAAWLTRLLGIAPLNWLALWEREPAGWLARWCAQDNHWLAGLLRACGPLAKAPLQPATPLRPHASPSDLQALAAELGPAFDGTAPTWRGRCAETGTWTRLHDPRAEPPASAWERLGARIAELTRLSLPDAPQRSGTAWLATGALQTGPGEGLAWVEMSRGLLIHRARVEGPTGDRRVAGYEVLAPTDWNFHPRGAVARALESLSGDCSEQRAAVHILMAAYDPCVRFEVEAREAPTECSHA